MWNGGRIVVSVSIVLEVEASLVMSVTVFVIFLVVDMKHLQEETRC